MILGTYCGRKPARWIGVFFAGLVAILPLATSHAGPITFTGSSGTRNASVAFQQTGDQLTVTLVNTSTADVLKPVDILTAVFFNLAGASLTPVSAVVPAGSVVFFGPTDPNMVVSGEWAYRSGLRRGPRQATQGISSASLGGRFGAKNVFPNGSNLQGPVRPDGIQYGITSAGDNVNTGNRKVTGATLNHPIALIQNSVVFTFDLPSEFALSVDDISSVSFQYGNTSSKKKNVQAFLIPEPSTLVLAGGALLMLSLLRRRRRR